MFFANIDSRKKCCDNECSLCCFILSVKHHLFNKSYCYTNQFYNVSVNL